MDDMISRQAAIDAVYKCDDIFAGDMPVMVVKADAYEALAKLPSAQTEIIRCKDCKHWDGVDTCDVIDAPVWGNDFCSMAERRSDE